MITSKKFFSESKYHVSNKNKRTFNSVLEAQLDFKDETRPMDAKYVLHRMNYNKEESYYPRQVLKNSQNKGDLGDYLADIGLRSIQVNRVQDGNKMVVGHFEDENCSEYYFKLNKRKMRLKVRAISSNMNPDLEGKLNLEALNNFILTGKNYKNKK